MTNHEIIVAAVKRLNKKEKANIRWHVKKKTPICCGQTSMFFTDGKGAGCLTVMAGTRDIPRIKSDMEEENSVLCRAFARLGGEIIHTLGSMTQKEVRIAMAEAIKPQRGRQQKSSLQDLARE
jgi:hypothetical protein